MTHGRQPSAWPWPRQCAHTTHIAPTHCATSVPPCRRAASSGKVVRIDQKRESRPGRQSAGSRPGGLPRPPQRALQAPALLDLDGVIYLGGTQSARCRRAGRRRPGRGMKRAYVTNNASRSPNAITTQLWRWASPATAADIVASTQAAEHRAGGPPASHGSQVLVIGGTGLRLALRAPRPPPGQHGSGQAAGGRAGLRARHQLRPAGRGGPGAERGRLLCRLEC